MFKGPVCHTYGITGAGNIDYGVALVGIAPAKEELKTGLPMQGNAGRLTNAILSATGWHRDKTYCTNMCCWRPQDGNANRDPSKSELMLCIDRLEQELTIIKPKLIVALGAMACEVLTGKPLAKARGHVIWQDDHYVLPTYHPAAILHENFWLGNDIVKDFAKIPDVVTWQPGGALPFERHIIRDIATAQSIVNSLPHDIPIALDVETSRKTEEGIDVYVDQLLCFSISDGHTTYWFDGSIASQLNWPLDLIWCFQNGPFDTQVIYREAGVWLPIREDAMFQSYSLDERSGRRGHSIHGLKVNSGGYLGDGFYGEEIAHMITRLREVPEDKRAEYNMKDTTYTARLVNKFKPRQIEDNVRGFYERILLPAANTFNQIQYRGAAIHQGNLNMLQQDWIPRHLSEQRELVQMAESYGWPGDINLNSPKQLSKLLYGIIGLQGGPSTAEEVIKDFDHPFVEKLLNWRTLDHMLKTYIFGVMDDIKGDGRVHANVLLHGTVTGRLAYHDPPLQTIPKENKLGTDFGRIRNIFGPTNEDYIIVEADYSQCEVWTGAAYSNDRNMFEDLRSGDYHGRVCSTVYNMDKNFTDPLTWKYYRDKAKIVTFGVMYGSEENGLAHSMDCTPAAAREFLNQFFSRYYNFKAYLEEVHRHAMEDGEIVATMTGRKRRFPILFGPDAKSALRMASNFAIQSTASDATLTSLIELHPILAQYDSYILFTVHDSIIFEVNQKHLHAVLQIIREVMTKPRFEGMPSIPIDMKWGSTWGEAHITEE